MRRALTFTPREERPFPATAGARTIAERAFMSLHEAIVDGTFGPGDRLRIEDLAARFEISPTPIREALHRLEAVGLVENIPHRGARVAELSVDDLRDLYEARLRLEPLAIGRAAERFTPRLEVSARHELDALKAAERRKDFAEAWKAHTRFHFTFYAASGSPWLVRLITPLWDSSQRYRLRLAPLRADLKRRTNDHEELLATCAAGDARAASLRLRQHLVSTANRIAVEMSGASLFDVPSDSAAL